MAPKRAAPEKLSLLSEEELLSAQRHLASLSNKEKRSKMQCMATWLKNNPVGENNEKATTSRGAEREKYLAAYMQHMTKKQATVIKSGVSITKGSTLNRDHKWMCRFQIQQEYGEEKAKTWIDGNHVRSRPDRQTGSEEPHMLEYKVNEEEH